MQELALISKLATFFALKEPTNFSSSFWCWVIGVRHLGRTGSEGLESNNSWRVTSLPVRNFVYTPAALVK